MTKVDYFEVEVKYAGAFEEYDLEAWKEKARAEADRKDCFLETREETEGFAKVIDGKYYVENRFPCNKIAVVQWAYIREEEDEEDDD
mgnify:CR=1 FL=1